MKHCNWQKILFALALAAGGMVAGASLPLTNQAHGEPRSGLTQPPVLEDRSVPILRDILATLRQMDARLVRLDATTQRMAAKSAASPRRAITIDNGDEGTN